MKLTVVFKEMSKEHMDSEEKLLGVSMQSGGPGLVRQTMNNVPSNVRSFCIEC